MTDANALAYVRTEEEAENEIAHSARSKDDASRRSDATKIIVAMRGGDVSHLRAALACLDLVRRGYWVRYHTAYSSATVLAAAQPEEVAADIIAHGFAVEEPNRDLTALEYAEIAKLERTPIGRVMTSPLPGDRIARTRRYFGMLNRAMRDKLERGECVDVSRCAIYTNDETPDIAHGAYVIPPDVWQEDVDYCNADIETWIWSIGRRQGDGMIFAAHDVRFYQAEAKGFACLFLR